MRRGSHKLGPVSQHPVSEQRKEPDEFKILQFCPKQDYRPFKGCAWLKEATLVLVAVQQQRRHIRYWRTPRNRRNPCHCRKVHSQYQKRKTNCYNVVTLFSSLSCYTCKLFVVRRVQPISILSHLAREIWQKTDCRHQDKKWWLGYSAGEYGFKKEEKKEKKKREYTDSWAYRKNDNGPSPTFDITRCTFPSLNVLYNASTNAQAPTPFPLWSYQCGGRCGGSGSGGSSTAPADIPTQAPIAPLPGAVALISSVQGSASTSPYEGQTVSIDAVVVSNFQNGDADTKRELGGFYIREQDSDADDNSMTSEGWAIRLRICRA